jgi:hypothetical protein
MNATPESPIIPFRRWRRWLKRLALIGATLLLAGLLWLFLSPDEPPPDLSDFAYEPLMLSDDQNAYALFLRAVTLAREKLSGIDDKRLAELANGENWDSALARQWLDGTDTVWTLWEQAGRTPQGQIPLSDEFPSGEMRKMAMLASIRARSLAATGKPDEAVAALLVDLALAQRIQQSRGNLFFFLNGAKIRNRASATLRDIAVEAKPSGSVLVQSIRQLEATRPNKDLFILALRLHLHSDLIKYLPEMLDRAKRGLSPLKDPEPYFTWVDPWLDEDTFEGKSLRFAVRFPLLFKPNQTLRIYADYARNMIAAVDREDGWRIPIRPDDAPTVSEVINFGWLHPSNFLGRRILAIMIPEDDPGELHIRPSEESRISVTEVFLALLLYHREHGNLPSSLDALVPGYLPLVPRDYYDGQPIRYSRDLRAVWSVRENGFKPTGLDPIDSVREKEIYLSLDFAAPKEATAPAR